MKFNHSLQFNAVPDWITKYIDYSKLKTLIYDLEKKKLAEEGRGDTEQQALIETDADAIFISTVNAEVKKIDDFYVPTESKIFDELEVFLADEAEYEKKQAVAESGTTPYLLRDHEEFREDSPVGSRRGSVAVLTAHERQQQQQQQQQQRRRANSDAGAGYNQVPAVHQTLDDYALTLKKRAIEIYVHLCELRSYAELNKTGFKKALKKYRKTLNSELTDASLGVSTAYTFAEPTCENLEDRIGECIAAFARLTGETTRAAAQQLRLHLREHVVWERNTVWRDMIGMERRNFAASAAGAAGEKSKTEQQPLEPIHVFGVSLPGEIVSVTAFKNLVIAIIFLLLIIFPMFESTSQSHCLALVVTASLLWATEAMPLFVTSLLVPLLVVVLRIPLDENDHRMSAADASHYIFSQMWSSVIMLLLGGFTLAAALSKYNIAKRLAMYILSKSGTNPRIILLNLMFVAAFLSMWISNVAAPVLCFSLAQPLLRTLPDGSLFARAIVLGIALASNVGGMVSPIASPQNIIALENMSPAPSWGQWFAVAIPVSILCILLVWIMLIFTFPAERSSSATGHIRAVDDKFTLTQYFICFVTLVTIVLWVFSSQLEAEFGEMGVIALIPIVVFFGTGLLSSEDFNNFLWTIIALAMGGIALGKAVSSSGLLHTIATHIVSRVETLSLYSVLLVFGLMILVVATFVSHTVAALIILPLVASIGADLPNPHPNVLVMASALLCSAAMGLPTSGFPNVTAICQTDGLGKPYLSVGIFIKRGVLASLLCYGVVATVGYAMMRVAGY